MSWRVLKESERSDEDWIFSLSAVRLGPSELPAPQGHEKGRWRGSLSTSRLGDWTERNRRDRTFWGRRWHTDKNKQFHQRVPWGRTYRRVCRNHIQKIYTDTAPVLKWRSVKSSPCSSREIKEPVPITHTSAKLTQAILLWQPRWFNKFSQYSRYSVYVCTYQLL